MQLFTFYFLHIATVRFSFSSVQIEKNKTKTFKYLQCMKALGLLKSIYAATLQ